MTEFDSNLLDELIHSKLRLGIMSMLISVEYAEFSVIKNKLQATDGNLSANLRKLEEAGYIGVEKIFVGRKPQSRYSITDKGRSAFEKYISNLEKLINN
ncbi:TPA: transcriptional regulator [Candidatus Delongbacteria bacterium]|jgi:DNA-binding MarR family transcriptional regulator|nr:MAG: transcriptional regulator [Candidatus Delongbacteria bacterium GWF2_40_14]OGV99499.1 MAG: transcriptional regulator [Melioribacter sp. RIFOXYB12_FULL_38_5]HAQ61336.1 transcriptional regulator [Candidatus Delongbacteria bacterium]